MQKTKIYNLVILNEESEIVEIKSFTNENDARKALNDDYEATKKMLEGEGWNEDDLSADDWSDGNYYFIQYGESSYGGDVVPSFLSDFYNGEL